MCVRARQREEVGRAKGHRRLAGNAREGKEEKRAREGKPARSGGDGVDDGRIIHSDVQKAGGERVLCVCGRDRAEEVGVLYETLAAERSIVILVRYVLKKYAAGLNESLRKSMWH